MSRGIALFKSKGTTGGTVDKMDSIDGSTGGPGSTPLQQGDINFLYNQQEEYWVPYELDVDSGQPENDPLLISPDTNAGDKRWRVRFVRWLKNAINYAGDFIIKETGKGLVLGDGAHDGSGFRIYKPAGSEPVRIVPISDSQGVAFRNAADDSTIALFKSGGIDISGLVAPEEGTDPATKAYVDANLAWKKVEKTTLSNVAGVGSNDLSSYRKVRVTFWLFPQTDAVDLYLRTSTDNGSSHDAGLSDYGWRVYNSAGAFADSSDSGIRLNGHSIGKGTGEGIWGQIIMEQFNQEAYMRLNFNGGYYRASDGDCLPVIAAGSRKGQVGRNAFRLFFSSGNIASGHILVEGSS